MIPLFVFASAFGLLAFTAAKTVNTNSDCKAVMIGGGLSDRFPGVIAHGVHSITVEDLQTYFDANATEKNSIPTINRDLNDDQAILFYAPETPKSMFETVAMRATDLVLSHMDDQKYDIKEYSTLEKVVHTLHMHEVWHRARAMFEKIKTSPPTASLCQCVTDINNNGVMEVLRLTALTIREPNLMYGKTIRMNNGIVRWDGNLYKYYFFAQENNQVLSKPEEAIPRLTAEANWASWKKLMMDNMPPSDDYELAMFLYCSLKK